MLCAAPVELPAPSSLAGTPPGRHHPLTPATVDSAASVSYAEHSASLPRPPRSARPTRISLPRTTEPFARKASKVPARPGQGEIDPAVLARRAELASTRAAAASTAPLAGATGHLGHAGAPAWRRRRRPRRPRPLDAPIRVTSACWPFRMRRKHVDRGDLVTALRSEWKPFCLVSSGSSRVWRDHRGRRARLTSTKLLATSHANSSTAASSNTP